MTVLPVHPGYLGSTSPRRRAAARGTRGDCGPSS
jgi:hypothetical protein